MYILRCANGLFYTGSTINLKRRLLQHQHGRGANFTKKNLPVELVYWELYDNIVWAFLREKQIQGWSHLKKQALISGETKQLTKLSECQNDSHFRNFKKEK